MLHSRTACLVAALIALTALYVVEGKLPAFHALPMMQPDSVSYLEANIARTPAYPLILRVVQRLPGGLARLGPLQYLALLSAGLALAYRFAIVFGQPLLAALLAASILLNPLVVSYCFAVLPEAAFMALLMIHLSFVLALAYGWQRTAAVGAGATAAMLALTKPSGYAAVAGLGVLAFVHRDEWRRLAWLVIPAAVLLLAFSAGNYLTRGLFATQAQGGYSRAAYVAHLLDEATPTPYPDLARRIAARTSAARHELAEVPTLEAFYLLGANEYHVVESIVHDEIMAEIGRRHGITVTDAKMFPSDTTVARLLNEMAGTLADAAIRWRPREYGRQIVANVYGLWWLPQVRSRAGAIAIEQELHAELAHSPALDRSPIAFRVLPLPAYVAVRLWLGAVVMCGLAGLVRVWSRDRLLGTVGYVAVLLHGYFLLISLAQPGLPRYALAMWPASMLLVFSTIAVTVKRR